MSYTFQTISMPTNEADLVALLEKYTPFIAGMYTKSEQALYGESAFLMDYWLYLWDNGGGYFVEVKSGNELIGLAMLTKYRDAWTAKVRVDVQRMCYSEGDEDLIKTGLIDYLKSVAALLGFDVLSWIGRQENGDEIKYLIWRR